MVSRSDLVDVSPFRTGLFVLGVGLLLTLGSEGGYLGTTLGDALGLALGGTGVAIVGVLCLIAGVLLLSGASAGALIRRGAHAAKRSFDRPVREPVADGPPSSSLRPMQPRSRSSTPPRTTRTSSARPTRRR